MKYKYSRKQLGEMLGVKKKGGKFGIIEYDKTIDGLKLATYLFAQSPIKEKKVCDANIYDSEKNKCTPTQPFETAVIKYCYSSMNKTDDTDKSLPVPNLLNIDDFNTKFVYNHRQMIIKINEIIDYLSTKK